MRGLAVPGNRGRDLDGVARARRDPERERLPREERRRKLDNLRVAATLAFVAQLGDRRATVAARRLHDDHARLAQLEGSDQFAPAVLALEEAAAEKKDDDLRLLNERLERGDVREVVDVEKNVQAGAVGGELLF